MALRAAAITPSGLAGSGGSYVIGNSGVPFVLPGSGSMGNNGALTLTTALAAAPAITSCYVWMPAGAIVSASTAGWYYALFSSTTVAQVFNNTYTIGTPAIPASPTAFATTGPGAYTGASSAITAYSLSIPGNMFGTNGGLRLSLAASYTNTAANKTFAATYGALSLGTQTPTTTATSAFQWGFKNAGATGVQIATATGQATSLGASTTALGAGTVDTTAAQTLSVVLTNSTPATNNMVLANATVEVLPSVA